MNTPSPKPTLSERYITLRALGWLVQPARLRIYLAAFVILATLVGAFYALENWRGKRAWTRMQRELQAAGQWVELAKLTPPPAPDDQNFAMTPLLAPLFDFLPGTQTQRDTNAVANARALEGVLSSGSSKWAGWPLGQMTDWTEVLTSKRDTNAVAVTPANVLAALRPAEAKLAELRAACARPAARFNLRYDLENPAGILLPHLAVLGGYSRALSVRGSCLLALERPDEAMADVELGFRLVDTIRGEPLLISHLVRCAMLKRLLQPVWEGMAEGRWSTNHLGRLQARLGQFRFLADGQEALLGERAFGNQIIEWVRRRPALIEQIGSLDESPTGLALPQVLFPRGWFYFEQVEYNRLFNLSMGRAMQDRGGSIAPAEVEAATRRLDEQLESGASSIWQHRHLASMLLPALGRALAKSAQAQASVDLATVACALEQHRLVLGSYPDSIEALAPRFIAHIPKDVIQGGVLQYKPAPEARFVLYSIGWDGKDDGGEPGRKPNGAWESEQGDWVWKYPPATNATPKIAAAPAPR